jgi:type III secretion protein J
MTRPSLRIFYQAKPLIYLLLLFGLLAGGCSKPRTIVNGINEKEANEIIVFLASKGIDAQKMPNVGGGPGGGGLTFDIVVDSAQSVEALAFLNANGLPRRSGNTLLEIFKPSGLISSALQEKIRYESGLAEQIASTIRKIDGILDADVQLSFPEKDQLNQAEQAGEARASVYVKHQGVLDDPNTHLITKIKRLVASSVNELKFDNVTVIGDKARFSDVSIDAMTGAIDQTEQEYVRTWGIILAENSLGHFRLVFFSLILTILLLLLLLVWVLFKTLPLVTHNASAMTLFSIKPIPLSPNEEEMEEDEDEEDEDEEDEEEEEEELDDNEQEGPETQ